MATNVFLPNAAETAQVDAFTVTGDDSATTYSATLNGKSVSVLGAGTGEVDTATAWAAALAASTYPEFTESTWASSSITITRTANTPGTRCPLASETSGAFTIGVSGGAGTVGAVSTTVANSGPSDWKVAANWSTGSVPGADDVFLVNTATPILYGIDQNAVSLTSLTADSTFAADLGLPVYNANGYHEYRPTYLKVAACPTVNLGGGSGAGSGRTKLHLGGTPTVNVTSTGNPAEQGLPAVILRGTCTMTLNVQSGSVGVDLEPGDASRIDVLKLGYVASKETDSNVVLGSGVTLSSCAITQNGGVLDYQSNASSHVVNAGTATIRGTATAGTLNNQGGTVYDLSSGTKTTVTIGTGATVDNSRDPRLKTYTTTTLSPGATLLDPNKVLTFTNPLTLQNCALSEVTLDLGSNFSLQRS